MGVGMPTNDSPFHKYRVELVFAVIGAGLAAISPLFGGSVEVAWLAGVLSAILPAFVALVKHDFSYFMERFIKEIHITQKQTQEITEILSDLSGEPLTFAKSELTACISRLGKIRAGRIPLDEASYFQMIIECMHQCPAESQVIAINTIDERRWKEDPRQINYYRENNLALDRGVKIRRAFVVDKSNMRGRFGDERLRVLFEQIQDGRIDAYVMWREDLERHNIPFGDWVIFDKPDKKLFLAHADSIDRIRVNSAEMILDANEIREFENQFKLLLQFQVSNEAIREEYRRKADNMENNEIEADSRPGGQQGIRRRARDDRVGANSTLGAPGNALQPMFLKKDVITCREAAAAKNIPLKNELKTLILKTSIGLVALNLRGDHEASLRRVKQTLRCEEACLAEPADMGGLNLGKGTVCPILEPVWSLPQLIDTDLLALEYVSTNNGTYRGFFKFDPKLLLNARLVTQGRFSD